MALSDLTVKEIQTGLTSKEFSAEEVAKESLARMFEMSIARARDRVTFGKPIPS